MKKYENTDDMSAELRAAYEAIGDNLLTVLPDVVKFNRSVGGGLSEASAKSTQDAVQIIHCALTGEENEGKAATARCLMGSLIATLAQQSAAVNQALMAIANEERKKRAVN